MKIAYGSDLHLELGTLKPDLKNIRDVDVLVLAGDIYKGRDETSGWPNILKYAKECREYLAKPVVVINGNHEFYGEEVGQYVNDCQEISASTDGIYFLENDSLELGGVRFLGCTLWSDFKMFGDAFGAMNIAQLIIHDYKRVKIVGKDGGVRDLSSEDTRDWNMESGQFLKNHLAKGFDGSTVIVTHFPPIPMSSPKFEKSPLTPYFNNDWTEKIRKGSLSPDIWISGHTHHVEEKSVGSTRICSRQGGYPGELEFFTWGVIDI